MPKNYEARDKKLSKRKKMPVNSRGLITVILPVLSKKAKAVRAANRGKTP